MHIYVSVYAEDYPDKNSQEYAVAQIIPNLELRMFAGGAENLFRMKMAAVVEKLILEGKING